MSVGFGLYQSLSPAASLTAALAAGYKLVDCARVYRNEAELAQVMRQYYQEHPEAERIVLTSKITSKEFGTAKASIAVDHSIKTLADVGLRWDLFLLHDPLAGKVKRMETWKVLVDRCEQGLLGDVGVSNFSELHLQEFAAAGLRKPCVNQIELHPFCQQKPIVEYCQRHGITVQAYSPLVRGNRLEDSTLVQVAQEVGKNTAQILVKWSLQKGYVPLPKSDTPSRIAANLDVFDFTLSAAQMASLDALDEGATGACTWNPVAAA